MMLIGPTTAHAAIAVYQHLDRPALGMEARTRGPAVSSLEFTVVGQASEGSLIEVAAGTPKLSVDYTSGLAPDLTLTVFRVATVGTPDKDDFLDPLIPVKPGTMVDCGKPPGFFYIKLTAGKGASAGKGEGTITFKAGSEQQLVKISYAVLPFTLQDEYFPTIQATVRPMFNTYPRTLSRDERVQVLKNIATLLTRSYHTSSFAGFGGTGKPDLTIDWDKDQGIYGEMARYCLDDLGVKQLRIPAQYLFSKHHLLTSIYPNPAEETIYADLMRYRKHVETLITNPKWQGRLSMRLWDEPRPFEYPQVIMTYKAAKHAFPELTLELTEQPDEKLGDIADVWVVHPRFFDEAQAKRQQSKGKKIWIYCNKAAQSDEQLKEMRIIGWMLWRYGLDGYLFYSINYWNVNPWVQSDRGWAGTFVYPDYSGTDVYSSLKLEFFRDGIEDAAMMRQLENMAQQRNDARSKELLARLRGVYSMAEIHFAAPDPRIHRKALLDYIATTLK